MGKKPNIILINCDDLGYGDLGCYGSKANKTPTIDRLASEGILFTSFCMGSSICSPSRASMLTGCYPKRIGFDPPGKYAVLFPGDPTGLNPDEITIANILKGVGYATRMVGKWHCGDQPQFLPTNFGFDSYFGLPYSNDMGINYLGDNPDELVKRVIGSTPPLPLLKEKEVIQEQPDLSSLTERYVEQCVKFIRDNKNGPFFLYLAHMHVHLPHYPPQRFLDQSDNGEYGASVECIDWATDAILYELKKDEIDDNTIIIFTSDNGSNKKFGGSNYPLREKKGTCWEGGFRVPCIIRWPKRIKKGLVCNELISAMDFLPTLAGLAGAETPTDRIIDGKDISGLLCGDNTKSPYDSFFYYCEGNLYAVRCGNYKYFQDTPDYPEALYDLDKDKSESNNLLGQFPDIEVKCKELIDNARIDLGDDRLGIKGINTRPVGRVENPKTLTEYDLDHPYIVAMYDVSEEKCG